MESVEWIFSDHKLHLSMLQLLKEEQSSLSRNDSVTSARHDDISGMVLASPPLNGMPRAHTAGSSTEWVVMKLNSIKQDKQILSNEIDRYNRLLRLYDAVMRTMSDEERWFVSKHYDDGHSLSSLPALQDSPFQNLSRSTMSNYRKRLLQKAAHFFAHLHSIGN